MLAIVGSHLVESFSRQPAFTSRGLNTIKDHEPIEHAILLNNPTHGQKSGWW